MAIFKDGGKASSDRSQWDRKRHRQLVEEAIKKNIGSIVAEESIIGQSGDKKIKIPIKGIKEYQFIYGKNNPGTGSGTGGEERGQVVGKAGEAGQPGPGGSGPAGSEPGEDIFETEITLDELSAYLFEDLKLPDLERKKFAQLATRHKNKRSGFQKKGIPPRLAKKRTVIEKLKRQQTVVRDQDNEEEALADVPSERIPFREDDLKYYRVKEDVDFHSNAVVLCIMDTSGSMDQTRKYLARSFYFLLYQFVHYKYEHVEVVFVSHSTEAKEVTEQEFFHKGESGGTFISSGYAKALEIIEQRYNPAIWNIYAFHCSDGDNWSEDNDKAVALAQQLCQICNLFGYGNVGAPQWGSTIKSDFEKKVKAPNFVMASMITKDDIWPAFKKILEKDQTGGNEHE